MSALGQQQTTAHGSDAPRRLTTFLVERVKGGGNDSAVLGAWGCLVKRIQQFGVIGYFSWMIGIFDLVPRSHVKSVADLFVVWTADPTLFALGATGATQWPVTSVTHIKHTSVGIAVIGVVVDNSHRKIGPWDHIDGYQDAGTGHMAVLLRKCWITCDGAQSARCH
jgi:hypothetical protein